MLTLWAGLAPAADCHATIDARCSSLRGEEALRCHNEADAQCDISDAEQFTAAGDATDTVSRLDQARAKYEDLLNMMLADTDPTPIAETMIRYATGSASIFALLAREGEVEDLTRAVTRLERAHDFLLNLLERRSDLSGKPDLGAALTDLTKRLAAALDQLARREISRAAQRYKQVRGVKPGDGGALSYYEDAVRHSAAAFAVLPNFAYRLVEFDAELAQAELNTVMARSSHNAAAPACAGYRKLVHELGEVERASPKVWKEHPQLRDFQGRAERGARACATRPRVVAGGVLMGVGVAGLGAALGLYAGYNSACAYSAALGSCAGIPAGSPDVDRFTAQIRASIGLAVVGGALFTAGAAVLIHGLVQRKQAQPRQFSLAPAFGPHQTGAAIGLRF
jgi:tetratricopeptide (TPR) repeat protein